MIAVRPWLGAGTGSFPREFREFSRQTGARYTSDPHCEYLMVAAQWGVVGLVVFLVMLGRAWGVSGLLDPMERNVAQGMLVTVATGCLFNSLLLGFTGGLFFGYFMALCYAGLPETRAERGVVADKTSPAEPDVVPLARAA